MRKLKWLFIPTLLAGLIPVCSCSCNEVFNQITLDELGDELTLNNEYVEQFLTNPVDENVQADGTVEKSKPKPVHLSWKTANVPSNSKFTIKISEHQDMSDPYIVEANDKSFDLYNCKINTQYYWTVQSGSIISNVSTFKSKQEKVRTIDIDGVTNCRDLGGRSTTDDKHIKQGLIYRTGRYNLSYTDVLKVEITDKGVNTFKNQLHIKTEIDIRATEYESGGLGNKSCIDGIDYKAYRMDGSDTQGNMLLHNAASIKGLFDNVLSNPDCYPLTIHCDIGTDRTGCLAYTILAACGVDKNTLIGDYLLSNYGKIGGSRRWTGIKDDYPARIDEMEGSTLKDKAANALITYCGISLETINKVRNILVE